MRRRRSYCRLHLPHPVHSHFFQQHLSSVNICCRNFNCRPRAVSWFAFIFFWRKKLASQSHYVAHRKRFAPFRELLQPFFHPHHFLNRHSRGRRPGRSEFWRKDLHLALVGVVHFEARADLTFLRQSVTQFQLDCWLRCRNRCSRPCCCRDCGCRRAQDCRGRVSRGGPPRCSWRRHVDIKEEIARTRRFFIIREDSLIPEKCRVSYFLALKIQLEKDSRKK